MDPKSAAMLTDTHIFVSAYMKPYVVRVRFDDTEGQGETDNRGFSLNFIQKPCSVLGRRRRAALPWKTGPRGNNTTETREGAVTGLV